MLFTLQIVCNSILPNICHPIQPWGHLHKQAQIYYVCIGLGNVEKLWVNHPVCLDLPINSSWSLSSCFKSSFALFCSCKANSISFSAFCKLCSFSLRSSSRRSAASRRSARFAISSFLSVKVKICQISLLIQLNKYETCP